MPQGVQTVAPAAARETLEAGSEANPQTVRREVSSAWPDLRPADDAFVDHVRALQADSASTVGPLRIGDLYLAYLCGCGDPAAIETFERLYGVAIVSAVRRVHRAQDRREDLQQIVRSHLLVGDNAAVKSYAGRGSLAAWVGVVAMRTALNAARGKPRLSQPFDEASSSLLALSNVQDPELDYLRARYRADFRTAFADAVTTLDSRQRGLLHQHLVEKLTVRELARIYGVNSGTVARWIVRAREELAEATCGRLRAQLHVTPDELDSILRLIRSRVDLSLHRMFGDDTQSTKR